MLHVLKCVQPFFDDIYLKRKTFEVRKNDRNFKLHDLVELREYDIVNDSYSGKSITVIITYILDGYWGGGIGFGYCIFGFQMLN